MTKLRDDIIDIVEDILHKEHNNEEKQRLNKLKEDQLEMACPVCGDSKQNSSKKRGILYLDTFKYYCWNGECNAKYWSIFTFFKYFNKKISNLTHIKEIKETIDKSKRQRKTTKLIDASEHFEFLYNNSIHINKLENFYGLRTVDNCEWGKEFLKTRLLTKFDDKIRFRKNNFGNREVWVLNKINENDNVVGLQIKNLDYGMKYSTKSFTKLHEEMNTGLDIPLGEFYEKLSTLSIINNIFNIDVESTITVFEGALDSFFMKNSISTGGASKLKNFFDGLDNVRYWYDNDYTGKLNTIDKLKKKNSCFLWKKYFKTNNIKYKKIKDLNNLVEYLYSNKQYIQTLKKLDECFSSNKYDIYNV